MDFFYDGGEQVRPAEEGVHRNLEEIMAQLETYRNHDFLLLQEVDKRSKRSYRNNMVKMIDTLLINHHSVFGRNYDVAFVPLPPTRPMGKVTSGLQTLSAYLPAQVTRHSFPGNYSWPMSVFMLDRCFLVNRYPLPGEKELVVINTHNSAYDDGSLRQQQMDFLKALLIEEYDRGNYVVAGGDWNQSPAGFDPEFPHDLFDTENLTYIEEGYPDAGWTWAYDPAVPTNRRVLTPYSRGASPTTVIDFFLLSPNVELTGIRGEDLEFAWSDHQPVLMNFKLRN
jgi:endonuclease/exonuclease/phosphatase family metal-dependent hydrolase